MKKTNTAAGRRDFLKKCGLSSVPLLLPATGMHALSATGLQQENNREQSPVNFIYDGLALSPQSYLDKLGEINKTAPLARDFYGNGGATEALETEFARLTGKEKAIYLPTGTMANQIAIKLLSEDRTKVIVPENSHVFRDEADAAQSVHGKRLVPVGKGKPWFHRNDLEETIKYLDENEVFKSGLGTVVIENPVRRADGTAIPLETIKEIAAYCRDNGYKLHLDGARLHIASAYTRVSVAEYASCFDTVYISLYKYLNAAGGAVLCGNAGIIDQMAHQIKIYGGTVYQSWYSTAVAHYYLDGIEERWNRVVSTAKKLVTGLNNINGITITGLTNGTNIYNLTTDKKIRFGELAGYLSGEHNIWLRSPDKDGIVKFAVNESLLTRPVDEIIDAWKKGIAQSKH